MTSHTPDNGDATEVQALPVASAPASALPPGAMLGAYVIRGVLGEGGMGRVYLAEQTRPVRREVALKVIREQVASPLARAYFEVERQALAQMQHPAIAQVYDAGTTDDGTAYLAMEVVTGEPITTFCRDQRLTLAARLALFARVCHGVHHAHQKGIIHRDIKPANILVRRVDGEPTPTLIDFGIAIGDGGADAGDAGAGDPAGTAVYMSPEQAIRQHRQIDTRSDVYSLGVVLYEVLTDADAAALTSIAYRSVRAPHQTLLDAIQSDAGVDDRARSPGADALLRAAARLPTELRAVLRKALAADRDDRYESAAALAEDLQRFRDHRPLRAMPASRGYVARTFIARHRLGLAAASVVVVALLAGIGLAMHGLARAQASAAAARIEADKAERVADFVRGMLGGIDPDRAKNMDRSLMRFVLDAAADRAGRELATQPAVRSSIERTIADSYASIGEVELAQTHYDDALAAAVAAGDDLPRRQHALIAMRRAEQIDNRGRLEEALAASMAAYALVADLPEDDRTRLYIGSHLAGVECDAGHLEASRTRYIDVLARQRRAFGDDDPDTLASMSGLGDVDTRLARYDEARPLYADLIDRSRARYGDTHSKTLGAINGLAVVELEQKNFAAAEALLAPQLPFYERTFGADHPLTLRAVNNLGGAIRQQGRNEEARPLYERALAMSQKLYGDNSPQAVVAESNFSLLLRDAGQLGDAERHARAALDHAAHAFVGQDGYRAIFHRELAGILISERHFAEAETELAAAWSLFTGSKDYGANHPRAKEVVDAYVTLYQAWNKPDLAALWTSRKAAVASAPAAK